MLGTYKISRIKMGKELVIATCYQLQSPILISRVDGDVGVAEGMVDTGADVAGSETGLHEHFGLEDHGSGLNGRNDEEGLDIADETVDVEGDHEVVRTGADHIGPNWDD